MLGPTQLRTKHANAGAYFVDSKPVGVEQCSVRSMNFGQHWRSENVIPITYTITLPYSLFVEIVDSELPELIDDMKTHPDADDKYEKLLREHKWPDSVNRVMLNTELAVKTLEWLGHEMMLRWFGDGKPESSSGFVFNTIESVSFNNNNPVITGMGRMGGQPVAYQDT